MATGATLGAYGSLLLLGAMGLESPRAMLALLWTIPIVSNCRRLIKGYSDTHARAQSKFDRVLSALPMLEGREDAADWIRRLREAALKDEKGDMLDGALKTVATLGDSPAQ